MKKIKHPYNRLIKISDDHQQITLSDSRFYKRNGKYYPSITYVLKYYPKGQHFEDWLKKVGYSSEHIMKKAGEEGTMVHDLIEMYLNGEEIKLLNNNGVPLYNLDVWRMFINFVEFWETYKPKLIETEIFLFSDELEVAGTCDLICEIDGKLWLIDFKTSNHIQPTYEIQTAVYSKCYKEGFNINIDYCGILWLKSSKRKLNKEKMQGKGWEMITSTRTQEKNMDIFKGIKSLFDLDNPDPLPTFTQMRAVVKRVL